MSIVLLLGSGPNVVQCRDWPRAPFGQIVAINNAWQVRPDWTHLIHPDDFAPDRMPKRVAPDQQIVTSAEYVAAQNTLGGFVYAGGTMAFTAGYWALARLRPKVIAMLGCDMVYSQHQSTHFYGTGTADPLRDDITLRSLEAKSARLMIKAAQLDCAVVNLSRDDSRLILPRATVAQLTSITPSAHAADVARRAEEVEARLGYNVTSGKYWKEADRFDAAQIDALDALWLKAAQPGGTAT